MVLVVKLIVLEPRFGDSDSQAVANADYFSDLFMRQCYNLCLNSYYGCRTHVGFSHTGENIGFTAMEI